MTHNPHTDFPAWCREHDACSAGQEFANTHPTLESFWNACHRPDWMLWVYRRLELSKNNDRALRLFAVWCARSIPQTDPRSIAAIDCAERFANGSATADELARSAAEAAAARSAAEAEARSAAEAEARSAAWSAEWSARSAADAAAWSAARSAAWSAEAAARSAAWSAAWSAEAAARSAAWSARSAAEAAAEAAEWSARSAADAAAWSAAWSAEAEAAQSDKLRGAVPYQDIK